MKAQPKYKVCRRLGPGVYDQCQTEKFQIAETRKREAAGRRPRRKNLSNYGRQLLEKQKVRFTYGISERQFARYISVATAHKGNPIDVLYVLLESRLDNVVYRLGLASTRRAARQMVSHGHITVNGTKMRIPSHQVSEGDVIGIREGSKNSKLFVDVHEKMKEAGALPAWLEFASENNEGRVVKKPMLDARMMPFDFTSVIEFYSR